MKTLNASQVQSVSAGLTYDQVIGRGFTFGAVVGSIVGAASAYIHLQQAASPVSASLGAVAGTALGGLSGAVISVPFAMFFPEAQAEIVYF